MDATFPGGVFGARTPNDERAMRDRWERDVRRNRAPRGFREQPGLWPGAGRGRAGFTTRFADAARWGEAWRRHAPRARSALIGLSATAAAAMAFAAVLATKAYYDNPPAVWSELEAIRRHSPIFDVEERLAGSVGPTSGKLDLDAQRNLAFIPVSGALPPTYVAALKVLEDRHLGETGWLTWCGTYVPSMVGRWISSGGIAGGSGIWLQATALHKPEWGNETSLFDKVTRKFRQFGASCSLYKSYGGSTEALLATYASMAPVLQGNGTTRGIEAAAQIVFGLRPARTSDAQQFLLGAAVRLPIRLLRPGDLDVNCAQVYPRSSPSYDAAKAKAHPARVDQCRVVARAMHAAPMVLEGDRLQAAIDELREMQRDGIQLADDFKPVPAARLINLTGRTAAILPPMVTRMMVGELEGYSSFNWGTPLHLTIDAAAQQQFGSDMKAALQKMEKTGKSSLCIPVVRSERAATGFTRVCGSGIDEGAIADVFAAKIDVRSGAVQEIYSSTPALLDATLSAGSLAKLVIVLAAAQAGYAPDSLWCPRRISDGSRLLKRVGRDPFGYTDDQCAKGGKYLIRLVDGIARSDNLVAAEVARHLGDEKLRAALVALGLEPEREYNLWFPLGFGTQPATPRALLAAGRLLVAAAYGTGMAGSAPRILAAAGNEAAMGNEPQALSSLTPAGRDTLRQLIEAPVAVERGTLGFVADAVTAGKTGTTSSSTFDVNGHRNVHAKLAITYQAQQGALNLLIVTAPNPSVPLALHDTPGSLLAPAHRALLKAH